MVAARHLEPELTQDIKAARPEEDMLVVELAGITESALVENLLAAGGNGPRGLRLLIRMNIDWYFVVWDGVISLNLLRLMTHKMGSSCDAYEGCTSLISLKRDFRTT